MTQLLDQLIALVTGHGPLVYALIFLITALEAAPVVGAFLPGAAALVGLSALIPTGALALWPTLLAATAGAIVGDGWPYWVGHRYRERILQVWPLSRVPNLVSGSAALLKSHPIKSLVVSRFTPARAVVPIVAGIAGMPAMQFYTGNILSALAWAPAHVIPGALLGTAVTLLGAVAGRLAVLAVIVAVVCGLLLFLLARAIRLASPRLRIGQAWLWQRIQPRRSHRAHPFLALFDPDHPRSRTALFLVSLTFAGAWIGVAELVNTAVLGQDGPDAAIVTMFQGLRTSLGDTAMGDVALVLGSGLAVVSMLGLVWAVMHPFDRLSALWVGGLGLAALIAAAAAPGWAQLPVTEALGLLGQQSGPLTLLLGLFAAICAGSLSRRASVLLALLVALAVALGLLTGLYYGALLSTVWTGLACGLVGLGALGLACLIRRDPPVRGGQALGVTAVLIGFLGGGIATFGPDYAGPPLVPVPSVPYAMQAWWDGGWVRLPARRIDLEDAPGEPLTLQWAASPENLQKRLAPAGWRVPPAWTLRAALAWTEGNPGSDVLPVLPRLHRGMAPVLSLVKPDGSCLDCMLVLRLWRSRATVSMYDGPPRSVLVGTVLRQTLRHPLPSVTLAVALPGANGPRDAVAQALGTGRIAARPGALATPDWDGAVLVAPDPATAAHQDAALR